ncbi:MAG: hypothetical protein F6J94_21510 [Moorea sp. SIO1F2]|uniref:hypothetical protein n=1 Tax=Moorena sp. SIO1F2 TaxID=2607819 RepID=UPI0013B8535E|nr:hypothetical protein [Moorena sp. SIO1F2]NET84398.1 hypothetical protein [Moorena sp. SIO1F2]
MVSGQWSVVSGQWSAVSRQPMRYAHATRTAVSLFYSKAPQVEWHRLRRCDVRHKLIADS